MMSNNNQNNAAQMSPMETMLQMMSGLWVSRGIYIVAKLGIADYLKDGAKTAEELADLTDAHADSLYRILRMLAMVGVFNQDGENRFGLTPLSDTLLSDAPVSLRESAIIEMGEVHYEAWGNLLHTVKTGDIAFDSHFGMNIWEYFGQHPKNAQTFNRYMANSSALMNEAIGKTDIFTDSSRVVDVGGGLGGMISAILKANPQLEGILFDAPSVVEKSKEFLAERGLTERCAAVGGNFFESVPSGGDTYTMRWIIHDWEDSKSIKILKNIRRVMPDSGKLVLAEAVVPANGQPHFSKFFDLIMLTITGGRERTESEYAALLEKAGFKLKRIIPTDTFLSIIEAVPASNGSESEPNIFQRRLRRNTKMNIRPVTTADAENCGQVIYKAFGSIAEKHNFPHDFPSIESAMQMAAMSVNSPNIVGFVAEADDGQFLGSNFLWRFDEIAGVGPITVNPDAQAKGVGRGLMRAVIEAGRDAPGIRLVQDAFNTVSMSLYAGLGFDVVEPLALMQGVPQGETASPAKTEVRPLEEKDFAACAELCRNVHGFDRSAELAQISQMSPAFVGARDGRIVAYASAPTFWQMNHAVAETVEDMQSLLAGAARVTGQPLAFLLPTRQAELFRWCLSQKLRVVKPMTLMAMGAYQEPRGCFLASVLY